MRADGGMVQTHQPADGRTGRFPPWTPEFRADRARRVKA